MMIEGNYTKEKDCFRKVDVTVHDGYGNDMKVTLMI